LLSPLMSSSTCFFCAAVSFLVSLFCGRISLSCASAAMEVSRHPAARRALVRSALFMALLNPWNMRTENDKRKTFDETKNFKKFFHMKMERVPTCGVGEFYLNPDLILIF